MSLFFYILGFFAGVNEWFSRKSINLVQLNWLIIGFSLFGFTSGMGIYFESKSINHTPESISIEDIDDSYLNNKRFVTIKGHYDPYYAIEFGKRKKGETELKVTEIFIPLLEIKKDPKSKKTNVAGIFIQHPSDFKIDNPKAEIEITGMISNLKTEVFTELNKIENNEIINSKYSINPKGTPPSSSFGLTIMILSFIPAFGFTFTWLKRYKILQSNPEKISPAISEDFSQFSSIETEDSSQKLSFVDGELTGKMYFEKGANRNFYFIPTRVNFLEEGSVLCASRIDASSTFFGFKTVDREGIWSVQLNRGEIESVNNVFQYFGLKKYKAIEVKFKPNSKNKTIVLAFNQKDNHKKAISNIINLKS